LVPEITQEKYLQEILRNGGNLLPAGAIAGI
jgi:hypothetical protein